ncbi:MAG: SDR family oxidoreductase [Rhodococcus sp. (in: high G+C Gram-positive bacteria)]
MKRSVNGLVVAITGGGRGIGLATAAAFAQAGATVAVGDIDTDALEAAASSGSFHLHSALDVTDPESFDAFLDTVERELGPIDVLVNNAGIMPVGSTVDEPDAVARRMMDINVHGVIIGSKAALRRMLPRRTGHVITVASLAGETVAPGLATYCASKSAAIAFTEAARIEYRSSGVVFSTVLPWFVETELTAGTKDVPFLKKIQPQDIANAVVGLVLRPRPKVRVPTRAGVIAQSQHFMPRRLAEFVNRSLGSEQIFLGAVDTEKRRAYEDRARGAESAERGR